MCIFKQAAEVVTLLPVKPHQIYKDITLLKQHLKDFLAQLVITTNLNSQQIQLPQDKNLPC